MANMYRAGWTYVPVGHDPNWEGKQYEYSKGGQHFVVKDGTIYRQAKEMGRDDNGHDWASKPIPQVKRFINGIEVGWDD